MSKSRRHFSPEQKAEIVRRHVAGKEPVSNLADEFNVQPTQSHGWVKQVLDQAERAFEKIAGREICRSAKDARSSGYPLRCLDEPVRREYPRIVRSVGFLGSPPL